MAEREKSIKFELDSAVAKASEDKSVPDKLSPENLEGRLSQLRDKMKEVERMIPPEHLELLAEASGGFHYRWAWELAAECLRTGILKRGYTDMRTKDIYINPLVVTGIPEADMPPMDRRDIQGFYYHEAGHHAGEVRRFQDDMMANLKDPKVVPEIYQGDEQTELSFLAALHSHLHNTLADIWDEAYMGRYPYAAINHALRRKSSAAEMASLTASGLSKPEQFCQLVLKGRYSESEDFLKKMTRGRLTVEDVRRQSQFRDSVDSAVFDAYVKTMSSGAIRAMMRQQEFESPFIPDWKREQNHHERFAAYKDIILPEYLKLVEKEVEERQAQKQEAKSQEGESSPAADSGESTEAKNQEGEGSQVEESGGSAEAVPLTPAEQREILERLAKELEAAGQERGAMAPSQEDKNKEQESLDDLRRRVKERIKASKTSKPSPDMASESSDKPSEVDGMDKLRQLARQLERQSRERRRGSLAEQMGVRQDSIVSWERTREKYCDVIESLASQLADVFLADRRKYKVHHRREGEITPGLEYETVAAVAGGETDPATRTDIKRNPEFLETEVQFVFDTSGSMGGGRLESSIDLAVIITESFKRVRELLAAEDLLDPREEQPFRVGVWRFAAAPEEVSKLEEPLSDQKEIKIIDKVARHGGGTNDAEAIEKVYSQMDLEKGRVIKIMVVLSDGQGNKEGLVPVMQKIEKDDKVLFIAVGMGDDENFANDVTESYLAALRNPQAPNIMAYATDEPRSAIPVVVGFLSREVEKRRTR